MNKIVSAMLLLLEALEQDPLFRADVGSIQRCRDLIFMIEAENEEAECVHPVFSQVEENAKKIDKDQLIMNSSIIRTRTKNGLYRMNILTYEQLAEVYRRDKSELRSIYGIGDASFSEIEEELRIRELI